MHRLGLALCFGLLGLAPAQSQTFSMPPPAGVSLGGCVYQSSPPTLLTGTAGFIQCDSTGNLRITGSLSLAGTTSNATSGVATSATNLPTVSYNYGFNGTTWDQLQVDASKNLKTTVTAASGAYASGAYASGSIASGAVASGAFASGSVASGAYASGSLASGAMVDLVALSAPVAPATATATKSALAGCQATSAGITPTTGQQAAVDCDLNNNLLVSSGGAPNLATSQASVTTGNISVASARVLRRAITITNITGTSAAFCGVTGVTTSTGTYLGATAGSSITLNTTAAVFCTVAATTQTVSVAETF